VSMSFEIVELTLPSHAFQVFKRYRLILRTVHTMTVFLEAKHRSRFVKHLARSGQGCFKRKTRVERSFSTVDSFVHR